MLPSADDEAAGQELARAVLRRVHRAERPLRLHRLVPLRRGHGRRLGALRPARQRARQRSPRRANLDRADEQRRREVDALGVVQRPRMVLVQRLANPPRALAGSRPSGGEPAASRSARVASILRCTLMSWRASASLRETWCWASWLSMMALAEGGEVRARGARARARCEEREFSRRMEFCLDHPLVAWGVLPFVSINVGYWTTVLLLELLLRDPAVRKRLIPRRAWALGGGREDVRREIPVAAQLRSAAWVMAGPPAIGNALISAFLMPAVAGAENPWPTPARFAAHLVLLELVGDYGLYWGHRIQHMVPYLWKHCHSLHHRISTPTPASTVFIDSHRRHAAGRAAADPRRRGGAAASATFCAYVAVRIAENVCNHSGLDGAVVDVVTLRFLPGRARIKHHDHHHQYSNRGAGNPSARCSGSGTGRTARCGRRRSEAYPVGRDQ